MVADEWRSTRAGARPQTDALRMVNAISTRFLKTPLNRNADAHTFIASAALDGHSNGCARMFHR